MTKIYKQAKENLDSRHRKIIMEHWCLLLVLITLSTYSKFTVATLCRACDHVAKPADCQTWTQCGSGEICFTREFKETDGKQAFHLGCEATELCTLYLDAQQVGAVGGDIICYNCCHTDECNKDLCLDSVARPTTTPTPKACPDFYMPILSKCYFFGLWESSWQGARAYCKKTKESDLASINSQKENDLLNSRLIQLAAPVNRFWLGGYYSSASGRWEWVDHTLLTFRAWERNYPPLTLNHTMDYYITLPHPVNNKGSKWKTDTRTHFHPFICELTL